MLIRMNYYVYDIETYPNVFTCVINRVSDDSYHTFEVSPRRDDRFDFMTMMDEIEQTGGRMVGFNNMGFDYPVIHDLVCERTSWDWYARATEIIHADDRHNLIIWRPALPQIDLYLIHHFNNKARSQSLKGVEFALRMDNIQDLPLPPDQDVPIDKIDELIEYNKHDVLATRLLFNKTKEAIAFRDHLTNKYKRNFTNYSDVKCGEQVLIQEMEAVKPGCCYLGKEPIQTHRDTIPLTDIILPTVAFERPEFQAVLDHFRAFTVTDTRDKAANTSATIDGFQYDYGLGGIHGSVKGEALYSDDTHVIVDVDVASYYPNLAIVNGWYPHHLSTTFCEVYKDIYTQRQNHPKGTPENAMLKLALNGAYGKSNDPYSPLHDPQYTMQVTVNGQLLLTMLVERLIAIPNSQIIQVNTDGLTIRLPRSAEGRLNHTCQWWEGLTGLKLEKVHYKAMFVRDVNNYISVYESGETKRNGAYEYNNQLHQNPSMSVVAKAAEAHLVGGTDIATFIHNHKDMHDFMMRAKVNRNTQLIHNGKNQQRTTRCYIATEGHPIEKVMPPAGPLGGWKKKPKVTGSPSATEGPIDAEGVVWDPNYHTANQSKNDYRRSNLFEGLPVVICNDIRNFDWRTVDYDWYIKETLKLTEVFE